MNEYTSSAVPVQCKGCGRMIIGSAIWIGTGWFCADCCAPRFISSPPMPCPDCEAAQQRIAELTDEVSALREMLAAAQAKSGDVTFAVVMGTKPARIVVTGPADREQEMGEQVAALVEAWVATAADLHDKTLRAENAAAQQRIAELEQVSGDLMMAAALLLNYGDDAEVLVPNLAAIIGVAEAAMPNWGPNLDAELAKVRARNAAQRDPRSGPRTV